MLDIGWSEMLMIAVVAIVVIGPRQLPAMLRTVGQWVAKARSLAREFQTSLDEMVDEAGLEDIRKIKQDITQAASFDVNEELNKGLNPGSNPAGDAWDGFGDVRVDRDEAAEPAAEEAAADAATPKMAENAAKPKAGENAAAPKMADDEAAASEGGARG